MTDTNEVVQPTGKKRGRPRKNPLPEVTEGNAGEQKKSKRPPCEDLTAKYPLSKLIFYEEDKKHKGIGLFHDPAKGNMWAIMSFLALKDGRKVWAYRVVPNKYGGKPIIHHDMVLISPSNARSLAKALLEAVDEWAGGQLKADEDRIEYQKEKKEDTLGDKIRKAGIF
jgi:hypothetical protein